MQIASVPGPASSAATADAGGVVGIGVGATDGDGAADGEEALGTDADEDASDNVGATLVGTLGDAAGESV